MVVFHLSTLQLHWPHYILNVITFAKILVGPPSGQLTNLCSNRPERLKHLTETLIIMESYRSGHENSRINQICSMNADALAKYVNLLEWY